MSFIASRCGTKLPCQLLIRSLHFALLIFSSATLPFLSLAHFILGHSSSLFLSLPPAHCPLALSAIQRLLQSLNALSRAHANERLTLFFYARITRLATRQHAKPRSIYLLFFFFSQYHLAWPQKLTSAYLELYDLVF